MSDPQKLPSPEENEMPAAAPRSLACQGDAGDIRAWSNIPYYLFQAARPVGFLTDTLDTTDSQYARRRLLWTLRAPLRLEGRGGYQYSPESIRRMWAQVPENLRQGEIVSHFQLFPPLREAQAAGVRHSFYCDATLQQLFDADKDLKIGRRTRADALEREKELYHAARFVVSMARATAEVVIRDYGVDPSKVFVVRAGANLDETEVKTYLQMRGPSWRMQARPFTPENPAQLGFIGRDYLRKGLPRLIEAAEVLHRRGRSVQVTVIGSCPEHLRSHPLVRAVGMLDKRTDTRRFLETMDGFAISCLPSYSEPLGISTLEALRLGIPVMGAAVGGIPDCVPEGGGFLFPVTATGAEIADEVDRHLFDESRYLSMVRVAERVSESVTWDITVRQLQAVWKSNESMPAAHQVKQ